MTGPDAKGAATTGSAAPAGERPTRWWLRPRVALPVLAAVIAAAAVLTPQETDARAGDERLSTYSSGPMGARLLHDLAERHGWSATRQRSAGTPADTTAIIALLAPAVPPSAEQAHAILQHVRRGGALLYVATGGDPLGDSLRIRRGAGAPARVTAQVTGDVSEECLDRDNGAMPLWAGGDMQLWPLRWRGSPPRNMVTFAETSDDAPFGRPRGGRARAALPAAGGFALGAGRVVAIADPDLLRNDVVRVCRWGADVAYVRMLEYLGGGSRRALVFDEYHQGYGFHPGTFTAVVAFFARTPEGHALAGLLLAGLVLLMARAFRIVPPRDVKHVERRSPIEHVQALARAYENVGASRTAALRLLHGVRRRVARHGAPPITEDGGAEPFLQWVERRAPAASGDVEVLRRALAHRVAPRELVHVGEAVRRIESSLTLHVPLRKTVPATVQASTPAQPLTS